LYWFQDNFNVFNFSFPGNLLFTLRDHIFKTSNRVALVRETNASNLKTSVI
jgi:hypothetical protein